MSMERLQILLTAEQRRRLSALARERREPVTALIREAVDLTYPPAVSSADRRAAARQLLDRDVPFLPPGELDELLSERFDLPR